MGSNRAKGAVNVLSRVDVSRSSTTDDGIKQISESRAIMQGIRDFTALKLKAFLKTRESMHT